MAYDSSRRLGDRLPKLLEGLALAVIVAGLAMRSTVTESPQARFSATAVSIFDQPYSLCISVCLASCGLLLIVLYRGRQVGWWAWLGLALFILGGLSGLLPASDKRAAITSLVVQTSPVIMGLGLACVSGRPLAMRLVLALGVAVGVANAIESFNQVAYLNKAMVDQYQKDPNAMLGPLGIEPNSLEAFLFEHRLLTSAGSGYLTTRNSTGLLGAISLCCLLAIWVGQRDRLGHVTKADMIYAAAAVIISVGIVLSRAKTAAFGLFAAGTILGCTIKKGRLRTACRLIYGMVVTAILIAILGFAWLGWSMPQSLLVRWQYWTATGRMIADHTVFGVGPGNFSYHYCTYKPAEAIETVADPHNLVLSLLSQYGPIGLLGWGIIVIGGIRRILVGPPVELDHVACKGRIAWPVVAFVLLGCTMFLVRPMVLAILQAGLGDEIGPDWLEATVPGLLLILVAALILTASGRAGAGSSSKDLPLILCWCLSSSIATGLVDYAPFEPANATWFWAVMGSGLAYTRRSPDRPQDSKAWSSLLATIVVVAASGLALIRPTALSSSLISQAYKAVSRADIQAASMYLDRAIKADPLCPAAASLQARLLIQQARQAQDPNRFIDAAIASIQIAIERNRADFRQHERLAEALELAGRYQQAYQAMQRAATLYPTCERLWFRLGQLAEACNRPHEAIGHYRRAIQLEQRFRAQFARLYPDWPRPVSRLGQVQYRMALERIGSLSGTIGL